MQKNTLHYDNSDFKIGNHVYHTYLCEGMRGRGKSTYWLAQLISWVMKNVNAYINGDVDQITNKFTYVRRKDTELQDALSKGIFNDVFIWYKNQTQMVHRNIIPKGGEFFAQIGDSDKDMFPIGYYFDLNKVKGISVPDTNVMLFDEFIADKRSGYKGGSGGINEPEILARLDDTLFRRRENWIILCGNSEEPSNPYCEYFHVPFGVDKWRDRDRGIWYEYDKTEAAQNAFDNSVTGKRWKGTTYAGYAKGEHALLSINEDFIAEKPKHCKQLYNLRVMRELLTIWLDPSTYLIYITDNCAINNTLPIYAVFNDDMSINAEFMGYNPQFVKWLQQIYAKGSIDRKSVV